MGVQGLTTYLRQDSRNFQDYKLHNTTLIIDAANMICNLYFNSTLYTQFNGEYSGLFALVADFIVCLKRCAVRPIFVFDGCHQPLKIQTQLKRNRCRLQTCKSFNALVNSSYKKATDPSFRVSLLPPLLLNALADVLILLNVEFVTSDRESDQDAISLAIHFNCPVLSGDSDFFITIPESHDGVCYLPICYFDAKSHINPTKCDSCNSTNKTCHFIKCKKFLPHGPGLNGLPLSLRPLLACLLGNDYIRPQKFSRCFPVSNDRSKPMSKAATRSMVLKRRFSLIRALIKWICSFNGDVKAIIEQLMNRYPTSERPKLRVLLDEGMRAYQTNINHVVTSFWKYFNDQINFDSQKCSNSDDFSEINFGSKLPHSQADEGCKYSSTCEESFEDYSQRPDSEPHFCSGTEQENSLTYIEFNPEDCFVEFSKWPNDMIDGFRKYQITPTFMDPIFSRASVLTCFIESLFDRKSVHSSSAWIRSLIYGLILGMEYYYMPDQPNRLIGVKTSKDRHSVTEYNRVGNRDFESKNIFIEPIILNKTPDTCSKFIEVHLGTLSVSTSPDWLKWLAVLTSVYHRSSPEANSDITSSVIVLSLGLVTICSYLNEKQLIGRTHAKILRKHYMRCAELLNSTKTKPLKSETCNNKLDIHIVHAYAELQVIYLALTTLGSLLDFLTSDKTQYSNPDAKCINLPSVLTVFPSGFLFHQVCLYLKPLIPSERSVYATQLFEKLLYSDKMCINFLEVNNLFKSYLTELVDIQTKLKIPTNRMNQTITAVTSQQVDKLERLNKTSKQVRKTHNGKREQDLLEERINRLMLENDLFD